MSSWLLLTWGSVELNLQVGRRGLREGIARAQSDRDRNLSIVLREERSQHPFVPIFRTKFSVMAVRFDGRGN